MTIGIGVPSKAASRPARAADPVVWTTATGPTSWPSRIASEMKRSAWAWRKRLVPNWMIGVAVIA